MTLSKLGQFLEQSDLRNIDGTLGKNAVVGLSTTKQIIPTKADLNGVNLTSYKIMPPHHFAYVPDTSRRGDKISLGYNTDSNTYLVSSISIVFKVNEAKGLLSDYLYLYFTRPEFDRYARFNSWGSAREAFSWDEMCDVSIVIPPLPIQQEYVNVYNSMLANQRVYERGLEDLKLVCDVYVEQLRRKIPHEAIGQYLQQSEIRNKLGLGIEQVRGLATSKEIIDTKANLDGVQLSGYKIVPTNFIAYVPDTSRRGEKMSLGFNNTNETLLVSSISIVFGTNMKKLLPEFLMLFLTRSEFDRYARFNSWGSARETFNWDDMCAVKIPIPDIGVQRSIVNIYNAYIERRDINERLKEQLKELCPILIKGAIEEGTK